jgi:soluble P-type ATPase
VEYHGVERIVLRRVELFPAVTCSFQIYRLSTGTIFMELNIPGTGKYRIQNLLLDLNGTLTADGDIIAGIIPRLEKLGQEFQIYILTADTRGNIAEIAKKLKVEVIKLSGENTLEEKRENILKLGASNTIAIGNGQNDVGMLREAAIGIVVIGCEGACGRAIHAADLVVTSILDALDCILNPLRLVGSLRG